MNIKEKISARMDELEASLIAGKHLVFGAEVNQLIASIAKFTSVLSSAERDFLNAAKMAVANKNPWQ
jgi:hypothetical protein